MVKVILVKLHLCLGLTWTKIVLNKSVLLYDKDSFVYDNTLVVLIHSGSEDDPDQNNFQKNFTKTLNKIFLKRTWPLDS